MITLVKIYKYLIFVLTLAIYLAFACWVGMIFEAIVLILCFLISKEFYRYKYHASSAIICLCLSTAVFAVSLRLCVPMGISYTSCGVVGLLVAYTGQYVAKLKHIEKDYCYIEPRYEELRREAIRRDIFSMDECSLRQLCKELGMDDVDHEITILRVIYHYRGQDLYSKVAYSKQQVIRREKRIEQRLGVRLK